MVYVFIVEYFLTLRRSSHFCDNNDDNNDDHAGADPGFWNGGAQVERRRREYRGAAGADGGRV